MFIHGIDVDSELIARAKEASIPESAEAKFHHIDFMTERAEEELGSLLEGRGNSTEKPFDIVFCFSVTMWIHLVSWQKKEQTEYKFLVSLSSISYSSDLQKFPGKILNFFCGCHM